MVVDAVRVNKIALYAVSRTSHERAPVGLCSPPSCMIGFVSKKMSRGEMEIDEEQTSDTTLRPDFHLATITINCENYFHQHFFPGQAYSGQSRLSQSTPSRAIAELLHTAGHTGRDCAQGTER